MNFPPFKKLTAYDESLKTIATSTTTMKEPEANPEGENKPDFTIFLQKYLAFALVDDYRSNHEIATYFWKDYVEPLQAELKTLRQQLAFYCDKNQNQ